jgi:tetratricopeptide (TPR) repeat protein
MKHGILTLLFAAYLTALLPALPGQQGEPGNSETIRETGQQYRQGNPLTGASDNRIIGRQAMADASLAGRKNVVEMKPNTFLSLWNNPAFAAQFEKFLSAPAETSEAAATYRKRIDTIMGLLSPGNATQKNQDEAFQLLAKASEFESDANLCNTIHDAIYTAANVRAEIASLIRQNMELERQLKIAEYNNLQASRSRPLDSPPAGTNGSDSYNKNQDIEREARMAPTKRELASLSQTIERNRMRIATAEPGAKFQLQSLILQFFVQRRYQHVIIANRFYRAIFNDGDQSLESFEQMAEKLGYNKEAGQMKLIAKGDPKGAVAVGDGGGGGEPQGAGAAAGSNSVGARAGGSEPGAGAMALSGSGVQFGLENASVESLMNAVSSGMRTMSKTFKTLSQLDGVANEIIRDVNEGVKVYKYLLEQNELESASAQLASLFTKGEYLPSVRLLTQDEKRRTLKYAQLCNKLVNASNSGNIDAVAAVVTEMKKVNPTFDDAEIMANVQGVKTASSLHIAQARLAATKGDIQTVQTEITRAAAIWPNNPEIQSFSTDVTKASEKASPQVQAVSDFDQLHGQKNFRGIFDEKEKYIAAIAADDTGRKADREAKLREVISRIQEIEASIMRSQEIDRRGDHAGAWEVLEIAFGRYPDDQKLSQSRADLTTQAPDFVHDIRQAKSFEEKKEYGSALAWYLRARNRYPMSDLSTQGIQRVVKKILPDAN